MMISLGMDIGGTGCKCAAFDDGGTQLALAYEEYSIPAGTVELPAEVLKTSMLEVIGRCTAMLSEPGQIRAIGVCSFGESFLALDQEQRPLGKMHLYFGNTGNEAFLQLVENIGTEKIMKITRVAPRPSYSLAGMLQTIREAGRPVWKFLFAASYLCFLLTGEVACDISLACRSMLYDVEMRDWSEEMLAAAGIRRDQLPEILPSGGVVGTVLLTLSQKLGLPENVRVVLAGHDQIANALGAGVTGAGDAADISGTCECVTPLFRDIPQDLHFTRQNYACVPYLQDAGYVTYAYNISAGSVLRWYRDVFGASAKQQAAEQGISIYDVLNHHCAGAPTDIMLMPFLQGMGGTPDADPAATGVLVGLSTRTRLPEIYRAILESVTFEIRYNVEQLRRSGVEIQSLKACGGGARSAVWLQIKADVLNCEIIPVCAAETGAMGCAVLALGSITGEGPFQIAKRFSRYGVPVLPQEKNRAVYDEKYARYKRLRSLYLEHSVLRYGK